MQENPHDEEPEGLDVDDDDLSEDIDNYMEIDSLNNAYESN